MMNVLEHSNWTVNADFVLADIIEYDMKRAGLSIIKENNLLPEDHIQALEKKEKRVADEEIGKLNYKIKGFSKTLEDYKRQYRIKFGELNDLINEDIVAVKSDAIFCKKYCENTKITDNIMFREKNYYHAMMKLGSKIELYWNEDTNDIHVNGIKDDMVVLHKDYLLKDIAEIMSRMASYDYKRAVRKLIKLMDDYKNLRLPIGYYREFKPECSYMIMVDDNVGTVSNVGEDFKDQVVIHYNYVNVFLPILNLLI